ncbi:MAG: NAD(P)-dependent oxidoreductase [Burkholderiales bacterium]|nr:NAD(P)-dependent oxidoreductase [Burkholderiales bacterium]
MPDVIVTGGGGFVGRALCRRLMAEGREVLALSRADGDITDGGVWNALPPAKVVVHLAGQSFVPDSWKSPDRFLTVNVDGTKRALEWCRRNGARLVFASAYVYGIPESLPIRESHPVRPNNPYALSKYLAEQCCEFAARYQGVNSTVLRVFNVFGPGQREEFLLPTLVQQLAGSEIRVMDLAPKRDYVYLPDVVDAFVRALDGPTGFQRFNIGSGISYSVAELVAELQAAAGTKLPVVSMAEQRPQEIPDVRADINLAGEVLAWAPVFDLAAGIRDMLKGS